MGSTFSDTGRGSGSHPRGARRPRFGLLTVIPVLLSLVVGVAGYGLSTMTNSSFATGIGDYFVVQDQQGANDVPAQSDLTQFGRSTSDPNWFQIFWSWDSTDQWTGSGQTGDACALFDYVSSANPAGDGKIDAAVCGQITNKASDPSQVVQNHAVYVFRCDNTKLDRCGQPSAAQAYSASDLQAGLPFSPVGQSSSAAPSDTRNLVTTTDPFPTGSQSPKDVSLAVNIRKDYLKSTLGTSKGAKYGDVSANDPRLTNVCSYPSAGNGGNNNPFDCISTPGAGFVVAKKDSGTTTGSFDFSLNGTKESVTTTVGTDGKATGVSDSVAVGISTGFGVSETVTTGWKLDAASCKYEDGSAVSTTFNTPALSGVKVRSGQVTTCTFTNSRATGSIIVKKVKGDDTSLLAGAGFTATPGVGSATSSAFTESSTTSGIFCLDGLVLGSSYTVSESKTPDGYNTAANTLVEVKSTASCVNRLVGTYTEDLKVKNTGANAVVNILKKKDDETALAGAKFTLYADDDKSLTWTPPSPGVTGETTVVKGEVTTTNEGKAQWTDVAPEQWVCAVETSTPPGYATAVPQCFKVELGTAPDQGQVYNKTFVDNRNHKVIVVVCHEGTDTLDPSSVTLGGSTPTTSLAAADLGAGSPTEAQLCALSGSTYGGLNHDQQTLQVTPGQ